MKEYGKYSAIAFQLLAIVFLGTYAGYRIDMKLPEVKPLFTVVLSLASIGIGLYVTLKDLTKK
ncbi:MAG TPA: AtpZ/AtpI family protein [Candidatus Onthomorpha intestinigallinarum]|uniref:AtpZ/AtpI family protein n=1 Tax=Candidatus Onthomorpha intestinigallinarum TaxID=2840880 RepID=A0A9D1RIN4_9BACT|nr:AtpZ/AtpI family protein [Candidatus Onthomorpha intestinigallinarum]